MNELSMSARKLDIKQLEAMVCRIHGVDGCSIVTDRNGAITEIHVVSESSKEARLVSRDVQTLLKVKAQLDFDFRKISVTGCQPENDISSQMKVLPSPPLEGSEPDHAPDLEAEPLKDIIVEPGDSPRVLFQRLSVTHSHSRVIAEVTLSIENRHEVGESEAADTGDGHLAAVIQATLQSILQLFQPNLAFDFPQFQILTFGRERVMVVYLSAIEGREFKSYIGSAVIRQDIRQTAVLATLSGLNRVASRWDEQASLDIEII
jgi:hypothetical protein